jgi:hypothetical protein
MAIRGKQIGWSKESNLLWQILQGVSNLTKQFSVKCPIPSPPGTKSGTIPPRQIGWSNESELLWEISRELNRTIAVAGNCGNVLVNMENFLDTTTPGYPVGVWNVNDVYLGTADTQDAAATLWNSDPANQAVGQISSGPTPSTFYFEGTTPPDRIRALRYYRYTGQAGSEIFVGANDIIKYASTTKTGLVDGVVTNSDTRGEWNRALINAAYNTKIPTTNVRVLVCTGNLANAPILVFHNEDSEYVGVKYGNPNGGAFTIYGAFPVATRAIFMRSASSTFNYNNINNWPELTSLWSIINLSAGGGVWNQDDPTKWPTTLNKSQITQVMLGQFSAATTLLVAIPFMTQTNYPNVSEIVFDTNSAATTYAGAESWFLNMPKVTKYLSGRANTAATTAVADLIWNNIATNLTGIVPVLGSQAQLRVRTTTAASAASLTSRTYLAAQGWTVSLS